MLAIECNPRLHSNITLMDTRRKQAAEAIYKAMETRDTNNIYQAMETRGMNNNEAIYQAMETRDKSNKTIYQAMGTGGINNIYQAMGTGGMNNNADKQKIAVPDPRQKHIIWTYNEFAKLLHGKGETCIC